MNIFAALNFARVRITDSGYWLVAPTVEGRDYVNTALGIDASISQEFNCHGICFILMRSGSLAHFCVNLAKIAIYVYHCSLDKLTWQPIHLAQR